MATFTGEPVSAQTVSNLTRHLDAAVRQFHQVPLRDDWIYLFSDGVSLRVRQPAGRKRLEMLAAYGVRRDGSRQLTGFPTAVQERTGWLGKASSNLSAARDTSYRFQKHWQREYPGMVRQLERDLPELLSFFRFPQHLWRQLRTTKVIEKVCVEVRRRTPPIVCFVNVASVDRIIYSIFHRLNLEWRNRTLQVFTQAA